MTIESDFQYETTIPVTAHYETIVIGGGWAGVTAACASARKGAKTLLIEKSNCLGGNATQALVGPFMPFSVKDKPLVKGIFQDIRDDVVLREGASGESRGFDVEILKQVLNETVEKYDVELLLHTALIDVVKEGRTVKGALIHNKSGLQLVTADYFIDTSGDADLVHLAGGQYVVGRKEDGLTQAMTKMFKIANVNMDEVIQYCQSNSEHFMFIEDEELVSIAGFKDLVKEYKNKGEFPLPQDYIFFVSTNRRDEVLVNTTRVVLKSGISGSDITAAELESLNQAHAVMNVLKNEVPGMERAYISTTGSHIGIRETRRIVGDYVLTRDDVLYARKFHDAITHGAYPIDIHNPKGEGGELTDIKENEYYDIPYRSLVPVDFDNVLVAGRCLSATHSAHSSARIQATCAAMGEAVGTAAGIASEQKISVREVDLSSLQKYLHEHGHIVKPDYVERVEVT
ncbi:FAD-dependent oxidoreductase [Salipaludibacillus keqinensis]|uniref:FAD-dependent oxidoreductase n=1 Tax=Salipaludibacillus keqinensis TaxID=2045207 RepID=A0A323TTH7_9BACI|nr:FAD-dependent oxidoreductase [Salipaludibacillus keqinensis]PYZ92745.1 FAD-dependent oxidoreductase [Salipaludibacillus keqinensis]